MADQFHVDYSNIIEKIDMHAYAYTYTLENKTLKIE